MGWECSPSDYQTFQGSRNPTNVPRKGRQTAVRRSRSRTPEDASLTQHEPSLAQRAVADMYEEARDPIWQACTPSPLVKDSDDEDGGIEAEWAEEEEERQVRRVMADCMAWERSYLERNSPDYDPYDY